MVDVGQLIEDWLSGLAMMSEVTLLIFVVSVWCDISLLGGCLHVAKNENTTLDWARRGGARSSSHSGVLN